MSDMLEYDEMHILLNEEQVKDLQSGEQIRIATQLREPVTGDIPASFNQIKIRLTTSGVINPESPSDLVDQYPEVEGLEELISDE